MKKNVVFGLTATLVLILSFILVADLAVQAFERCIMCGMDAGKSETKFTVQVTKGAGEVSAGEYSFCCLHCLVLFKARLKGGTIGSILVRDYSTIAEEHKSGDMIDATRAFYLIESKLRPKGSMPPFMLIFSDRNTAEMYKKMHGGKIMNRKDAWEYTRP